MLAEKTDNLDLSCEERLSDSAPVALVWRGGGEEVIPFISIAQPLFSMVISHVDGQSSVTIRGPEIRATTAITAPDAEHIGILFKPGVFMPKFPAQKLKDRGDVTLPNGTNDRFWLDSSTWQFPDYENIDTFVEWLIREELLCYDPLVADVLQTKSLELSQRTIQRRFKKATGISYGLFDQIQRARYATKLLKNGLSFSDTVFLANYYDQPHLIRSLKRFIGLTPQQVIDPKRTERLSFLYNTLTE